MEIKLDQAQSQSVYQLLAQRNLEAYQQEVERLMLGKLPPMDALRLALLLCDETQRQVMMKMTELENAKLHRLVNEISLLNGHGKQEG